MTTFPAPAGRPAPAVPAHRFNLAGLCADAPQPDAPALTDGGLTLSYRELDRLCEQVAAALTAAGVRAGDRVAYLGRPALPFLALLLGAAKAGAVAVPVNWRLTGREAAAVVADCGATLLVLAGDWAAAGAAPAGLTADRTTIRHGGDGAGAGWDDWLAAAPPRAGVAGGGAAGGAAATPLVTAAPGDVALQLYTSGTTGRPKGVLLSAEGLARTMGDAIVRWRLHPGSVTLAVLPLFHIAGLGSVLGALPRPAPRS